jgi:hypothetical protein
LPSAPQREPNCVLLLLLLLLLLLVVLVLQLVLLLLLLMLLLLLLMLLLVVLVLHHHQQHELQLLLLMMLLMMMLVALVLLLVLLVLLLLLLLLMFLVLLLLLLLMMLLMMMMVVLVLLVLLLVVLSSGGGIIWRGWVRASTGSSGGRSGARTRRGLSRCTSWSRATSPRCPFSPTRCKTPGATSNPYSTGCAGARRARCSPVRTWRSGKPSPSHTRSRLREHHRITEHQMSDGDELRCLYCDRRGRHDSWPTRYGVLTCGRCLARGVVSLPLTDSEAETRERLLRGEE